MYITTQCPVFISSWAVAVSALKLVIQMSEPKKGLCDVVQDFPDLPANKDHVGHIDFQAGPSQRF